MSLRENLRRRNRTLLEMHIGILVYGLVCQIIGAFFVVRQLPYAIGLWSGIFGASVSAWHMYRILDQALDQGAEAEKIISRGYLLRYAIVVMALILVGVTKILNPLVVFLGYMSLKVTALIQPFTHKVTNWFFKETDPEPEPMPQEELCGEESLTEEVTI